jgi:hypothetical protein
MVPRRLAPLVAAALTVATAPFAHADDAHFGGCLIADAGHAVTVFPPCALPPL